jgi:hypothetical protein
MHHGFLSMELLILPYPAIGGLCREAKDAPVKTTNNARDVSRVGERMSGKVDCPKAAALTFFIEAAREGPMDIEEPWY